MGEERRIKGGSVEEKRGTMAVTLEEWKAGGMDEERREADFCRTLGGGADLP